MMNRRGFTLIELLVVIGIIAVLAGVIFPVFARVREKARQTDCVTNQHQIATAVLEYVQDNNEAFPYSNSHSDGTSWAIGVDPYVKNLSAKNQFIWHCPDSGTTAQSYSTNTQVIGLLDTDDKPPAPAYFDSIVVLSKIEHPSEIVLLGDGIVSPDLDPGRLSQDGRAADEFSFPHPALQKDHSDNVWTTDWFGLTWNNKQISWLHSDGANFSYCDGHTKYSGRGTLKDANWDVRCHYGKVCDGAAGSPVYPAPNGTCGDQSPINCE